MKPLAAVLGLAAAWVTLSGVLQPLAWQRNPQPAFAAWRRAASSSCRGPACRRAGPGARGLAGAAARRLRAPAAAAVVAARRPSALRSHALDVDVYGRSIREVEGTALDGGAGGGGSGQQAEPVVKVYTVHSSQDPTSPWANKPQEESTGSGFAIEHEGELLILTNAHVVADAAYVEVRKAGDARKYMATRRKVSHECDLALLHVSDQGFLEGVQPLEFGSMPCLQDEVSVVGYPEGGEGVAITQGVVSRIEIQSYAHSGASLLAVQIDAAINPGNSGGPALDEDGKVIGVAFQNQQMSQNIGYVIPVPTMDHFLKDTDPDEPSRCAGFCSVGMFWQELENCQLREYFKLQPNHSGVIVRGILPLSSAAGLLRCGDVVLSVDGRRIANDATFAVGRQERLSFQHLVHLKFPGETIDFLVLRDGAEVTVTVPVKPMSRLVPTTIFDDPQPYFVYGGLAFLPLTTPYLQDWGEDWRRDAPHELVELALSGLQELQDEEVVILGRVFPSERTAGYSMLVDRRVLHVNGIKVLNLRQLYAEVQRLHAEERRVVFELQCVGCTALVSVETASAEAVQEEVMQTYRIPAAASPDLLVSADADGSEV